jgi:hypothetical protein
VFHIGNFEIGQDVEYNRDRNLALFITEKNKIRVLLKSKQAQRWTENL